MPRDTRHKTSPPKPAQSLQTATHDPARLVNTTSTDQNDLLSKLSIMIDHKFEEQNSFMNDKFNTRLDTLEKTLLDKLDEKVLKLESTIEHLDTRVATLEDEKTTQRNANDCLERRISTLTDQLKDADIANKQLTTDLNDIEQHGRRWSIRVHGLPPPINKYETFTEARRVSLNFLETNLKIKFQENDIDCAHRIGRIQNNTQPLLIKFVRRCHVDKIIEARTGLKGTGLVIYEDATLPNRKLLNRLKNNSQISKSGISNGKIWFKTHENPKKFQIKICETIEDVLAKN